ncbi:MAG: PDZ domain-containing protein [Gammaproteobacteria bacterium]|nr:PDZ domain-containing protein [Gammaproteobacteria bacterium]
MRKTLIALPIGILLLIPSITFALQDAERVFAAAQTYTTYIKTRIEVPFIGDERSTFFGAGFVIDTKRRWILTNAHVTGRSPAAIDVTFSDGTRVAAAPVYIDPYLDLAVLSYEEPQDFRPRAADLECRSIPGIGHPVGTFGHPEGLRFTGTRGIISGLSSHFDGEWLQTDAPISSGNSGGPLISLQTGRVVGINSSSLEGDGVQNANFAVLSTHACRIVELLRKGADPRPADLGVAFFAYQDEPTLVVGQVFSKGRAIGLQRGDQIFAVGGNDLGSGTEGALLHALRGRLASSELRLLRAGRELKLSPKLTPQPSPTDRRGVLVGGALFSATNFVDMAAIELGPSLMVHWVEDGSPAAAAGLSATDHLLAINDIRIRSLDDLLGVLDAQQPGTPAVLDLLRLEPYEGQFLWDMLAEFRLDDAEVIEFGQ